MQKFSFFIIIILVLQSCYNDNEEEIYGDLDCNTADVSYTNHVGPIINSSCATTNCHVSGGSGPGDFTNFNELEAKINDGSFENRVIVQKTMPPNSELSDCDLQTIQAWLDAGALNN